MAEVLVLSEYSRCFCCMSKNDDKRLQIHNIQNIVLRTVLQMQQLVLCYICKRLAEKTEQFVKNVESYQNLFQHFMDPSQETDGVLTKTQVMELTMFIPTLEDVIELSGKDENTESQPELWVEIKQEVQEAGEPSNKWPDSVDWSSQNNVQEESNRESESSSSSDDDDDGFIHPLDSCDSKLKDVKVKTIAITRDQVMEERRKEAAEEKYIKAAFKCEHCVQAFSIKDTYEDHMKIHDESSGRYECDICKRRMPTVAQLNNHYKYHSERYKCTKCDFMRKCSRSVSDHYLKVHCDPNHYEYTCQYCGEKYKLKGSLKNHIATKHKSQGAFKCNDCEKVYASKSSYRAHRIRKHAQQQERYICNVCGRSFAAPQLLKHHAVVHSDKRDYYCVECNKSFKTKTALNTHYDTNKAHGGDKKLNIKCSLCDKKFRVQRHLDLHMNVHYNIRPYKCDQCDKAYPTPHILTNHKRIVHKGYRNPTKLECSVCNKLFDSRRILEAHMRTHTGERPFHCEQCPAQFAQTGSLYNHVRLVHLKLTRNRRPKGSKKGVDIK